jgi:hypothetical protein
VETIVEERLGCALVHHAEILPLLHALNVIAGAPDGLFNATLYQRLCMKHDDPPRRRARDFHHGRL